jgi:hypothetical protein
MLEIKNLQNLKMGTAFHVLINRRISPVLFKNTWIITVLLVWVLYQRKYLLHRPAVPGVYILEIQSYPPPHACLGGEGPGGRKNEKRKSRN